MALLKEQLKQQIFTGFKSVLKNQSDKAVQEGAEQEDPNKVIEEVSNKLATVLSEAIDAYIRGGDIVITSQNVLVTSPQGNCTVAPLSPAKIS